MIAKISRGLASYFSDKNVIKINDIEIYSYGFELLLSEVISTLIVALIAVVTGRVIESVIYLLVFTAMRVSAGGFHAKTHLNCIAGFTTVFICFIVLLDVLPFACYRLITPLGLIVNLVLIWRYAPVDNPNKPFTIKERIKYRKRSIILCCCFTFISLLCLVYNKSAELFGLCIMLALLTVAISVRIAFKKVIQQ